MTPVAEPTQADKALAEAKAASDKSFMDEMDALTNRYKQPATSPEPEQEEQAVVVKPESDDSTTATEEVKADEIKPVESEVETEIKPSASEEEPQKGSAEYRKKQLQAEIQDLVRQKKEAQEAVKPSPIAPIQLMPDPIPEFKLQILKPEQAESFTNAQLFLWHNQAKEQGNEELANQYLNAISEKEQYEKHKARVRDYNERVGLVQNRRNESVARTKKDFPDMYNEASKMFTEYRNLQADPDFGEILNLISNHPNAPYAIARVVNNVMRLKYGTSSDALDKRVKELETELANAKKGKFPPRSGSANAAAPATNGNLTPSQQLDADFDALIAKRGRKI